MKCSNFAHFENVKNLFENLCAWSASDHVLQSFEVFFWLENTFISIC